MKEKYLPIGTVVLLKEATKRLMITGYCAAKPDDVNTVYDYVGCLFPEGNLAGDEVALFNHSQIGTISYLGLVDDEFKQLDSNIKEAMTDSVSEKSVEGNINFNDMPPLTPENVGNILKQIKEQGEAFNSISEPTAFDEATIKKPVFDLQSLGEGESQDKDVIDEEEVILGDTAEESLADGKPVLQLQPIFVEDNSTDSSSSGVTTNSTISGLDRL